MKTTLNLNDDLVAQAKAAATKECISLTKMIEEGLVLRLRRRRSRSARKLADLPVSSKRGGLRPGSTPRVISRNLMPPTRRA